MPAAAVMLCPKWAGGSDAPSCPHAVPFVFTGLSWPALSWLPVLIVEIIDLANTWQSNHPSKEKNNLSQMQPPTSRLNNKAKMGYVIGMLRSCEWGKIWKKKKKVFFMLVRPGEFFVAPASAPWNQILSVWLTAIPVRSVCSCRWPGMIQYECVFLLLHLPQLQIWTLSITAEDRCVLVIFHLPFMTSSEKNYKSHFWRVNCLCNHTYFCSSLFIFAKYFT